MKGLTSVLPQPVAVLARTDFATLKQTMTVQQALDHIRQQGLGERIIYFYVVDDQGRLMGVVPTRRLLTANLAETLGDIMIQRVVAIPASATVLEACEFFTLHKFFAFPVVDDARRIVGVVDVTQFTEEVLDMADSDRDTIFETLGFRVAQVKGASPLRAFRFRFPWLLANVASGTLCALLTGAYEVTLQTSLVLAFFLTLVLGLAESVSIQSMTVTVQALRSVAPTWRWYAGALRRELGAALLLGVGCGVLVFLIAWLWRGVFLAALVIGLGILGAIIAACLFGLSVPALLHALRLDPRIAAGPITLALADLATLAIYFSLAAKLLGGG